MLNTMVGTAVRVACRGAVCVVLPHRVNNYHPYVLRHPVLGFFNAVLLVIALGTSLTLSLTPEVARLSTITAPTIVRLSNAERVRAGLAPLQENSLLQRSAELKAQHMLKHNYFEHVSPDGLSPWAWFDRVGYRYEFAGENLAIDFVEAEDVVAAWVRSPGHRRNLLSDRYKEIGIAAATGEFGGRTATVVVQHFGSLAGGTPPRTLARTPPTPLPPPVVAHTPAPTQAPALPPPVITEPAAGTAFGQGLAPVRGRAPSGSTVQLLLDSVLVATLPAPTGSFSGTFSVPDNTEGVSELTARAMREGRSSALSAPTRVALDTRAPSLLAEGAILLPDPDRKPGTALLAVPASADVSRATLTVQGRDPIPLTRHTDVLVARVPLAELRLGGSAPAAGRAAETTLLVADARGNSRTITPQTLLPYVTNASPENAPRARVAAAVLRIRPWITTTLSLLTMLLVVNILFHVRTHHVFHADVLAHTLVVVGLGATLVFF